MPETFFLAFARPNIYIYIVVCEHRKYIRIYYRYRYTKRAGLQKRSSLCRVRTGHLSRMGRKLTRRCRTIAAAATTTLTLIHRKIGIVRVPVGAMVEVLVVGGVFRVGGGWWAIVVYKLAIYIYIYTRPACHNVYTYLYYLGEGELYRERYKTQPTRACNIYIYI